MKVLSSSRITLNSAHKRVMKRIETFWTLVPCFQFPNIIRIPIIAIHALQVQMSSTNVYVLSFSVLFFLCLRGLGEHAIFRVRFTARCSMGPAFLVFTFLSRFISVFSHTKHLQINNLHIFTIVFHFRHTLFLRDLLIHLFFPFHMSDHHLAKGLSLSSVHDSGIHSLLILETRLLYQYSVPDSNTPLQNCVPSL